MIFFCGIMTGAFATSILLYCLANIFNRRSKQDMERTIAEVKRANELREAINKSVADIALHVLSKGGTK